MVFRQNSNMVYISIHIFLYVFQSNAFIQFDPSAKRNYNDVVDISYEHSIRKNYSVVHQIIYPVNSQTIRTFAPEYNFQSHFHRNNRIPTSEFQRIPSIVLPHRRYYDKSFRRAGEVLPPRRYHDDESFRRAAGVITAAMIGLIATVGSSGVSLAGSSSLKGDANKLGGCKWEGRSPFCNGECPSQEGYQMAASDPDDCSWPSSSCSVWGRFYGEPCWTGSKNLCCRGKFGDKTWDGIWEAVKSAVKIAVTITKFGDQEESCNLLFSALYLDGRSYSTPITGYPYCNKVWDATASPGFISFPSGMKWYKVG